MKSIMLLILMVAISPSITLGQGTCGAPPNPSGAGGPMGGGSSGGGGGGACSPPGGNNGGCHGCGGGGSSSGGTPFSIATLHATDPNEIQGPVGITTKKWMAAKDVFGYTVRYENDPEFATGPAQKVLINIPIDSDFDINTLRLGNFGFGNMFFTVPPNSATYYKRLDVRDSLKLYVDVLAGINITNHEAIFVFESIDPATGAEPTDPALGFLPVRDTSINRFNDSIPNKGEGFISYYIQPKTTSHTGDTVIAQAAITFDVNAPVFTNIEKNTIDAVAPVSHINLPSVLQNTIRLSWTGLDDPGGCGVKDYDVYVSQNGNEFTLYQTGITDTVSYFTGSPGSKYSFYTLATDNTGNRETVKVKGDQTVSVGKGEQPPTVRLIIPADSSIFIFGKGITISASASDTGGTISKIEFYNGASLIYTTTDTPYTFTWKNVQPGNYMLTAKATDNRGLFTTSDTVHISVVPNAPPLVKITTPADSSIYTSPATIDLSAYASAQSGKIKSVKFYNGKTLLQTELNTPYLWSWKNVQVGNYTITARAVDTYGRTATSSPVTVKVTLADTPTVQARRSLQNKEVDLLVSPGIELVPNPAKNFLNIYTTGLQNKQATISIISASGVTIKTLKSIGTKLVVLLNVSSLPAGVYIIKLTCGDKVMHKQFVKM